MATPAFKSGPALSVTGVTGTHARRAIKWLEKRSLCAWFDPIDHSLNAFEFKHGRAWTDNVLRKALAETRNGARYLPAQA